MGAYVNFDAIDRSGTYTTKYDDVVKKFGTRDLLPLWVADMDIASPECVQVAIKQRAAHPVYGYTTYPERYYEAIKGWYAKRYGWQIEKEWIVPCYGVVPSLNFAIEAFSKEKEGVIVQTPIYPPFVSSVKHRNRRLLENRLCYENGCYRMDFDDLEAKAKEATLMLLCSPHNPTARAWHDAELERLVAICIANGVTIVSDEIHGDIVFGRMHRSLGSIEAAREHCIVLNAPSKTFNIAGLNTSFAVIANSHLRRSYRREQDRSGITNGNPFGIETLMAAYEGGDAWLEALKGHLSGNIAYVQAFLETEKIPIVPVPNEATFLMWLDCRKLGLSQEALVQFFVTEAKLGLNSGSDFGRVAEGFMRLNVGTSRSMLEEAMDRLLKAYRKRFG